MEREEERRVVKIADNEGEAMVMGKKVNYEEMDTHQKKENLGSILSFALNFMPPPPPPPK